MQTLWPGCQVWIWILHTEIQDGVQNGCQKVNVAYISYKKGRISIKMHFSSFLISIIRLLNIKIIGMFVIKFKITAKIDIFYNKLVMKPVGKN